MITDLLKTMRKNYVTRPLDYLLAGEELRYYMAFPIERTWHQIYQAVMDSPIVDYGQHEQDHVWIAEVSESVWSYRIIPWFSDKTAPMNLLLSALTLKRYDYAKDIRTYKHQGERGKAAIHRIVDDIGEIWVHALNDTTRETLSISAPPQDATVFQTNKWIRELAQALDMDILMDAYFAGVPVEHIVA